MARQSRSDRKRAEAIGAKSAPAKTTRAAAAEKPEKVKKRSWEQLDPMANAGNFFQMQVDDTAAKNNGVLVGTEAERVVIGLPLPAFSLQYVHCSDVYPLGRMEMDIGESDACKSAYIFEKMRWFLREPNAGAIYELNEARDPSDFRTSIVGRELLSDGRFRLEGPCESLENWQRNVTGLVHALERSSKTTGGCVFPLGIFLDSLSGTTNERAIESIDKNGCATLTFGQDANLINQYAKYLFQRVYKWPLSFVATNHIKFGSDKYGNKVMRIPGGDTLRYVSTYIFLLKKIRDIDRVGVAGREIELSALKSMGDHRKINVEVLWWFNPENGEQTTIWDWHSATVQLLTEFSGEKAKSLQEIIQITDVVKTTKTAKCAQLGFKKSTPWNEIGKMLMEDGRLLTDLQNHFGVKRRRRFRPNVPYDRQIEEARLAGDVERHDENDVAGITPADDDSGDGVVEVPVDTV